MYSKVLMVFAVVALAGANDIFQAANDTDANDIFQAANDTDYERVFDGRIVANWAITQQSRDVFVNASNKLISKINVTDLRDGKDGIARIVSGGLGHRNVTISLKSPAAFRGFDFLIEVFGFEYDPIDDTYVERGQRGEPKPEIPEESEEDTETKVPADTRTAPNRPHFGLDWLPTQDHALLPDRNTSTEKAVPREEIEFPEQDDQNTKIQAFMGYNPPRKERKPNDVTYF